MTDERLARLKSRLSKLIPNADEEKIEILLEQSEQDFLSTCNRGDVPEEADGLLMQMTAYRYNQLGAEGLSGQSFSGQSETLLTDWPEALKRSLYRYRKVKLL